MTDTPRPSKEALTFAREWIGLPEPLTTGMRQDIARLQERMAIAVEALLSAARQQGAREEKERMEREGQSRK